MSLSSDAQALYDALPEDGKARTNESLRLRLGLPAEMYLAARRELLSSGQARELRCRGGALMRNPPPQGRS